jgi:antitoxin component YwqK of YwqJK toxin-antitoxin module
MNLFEYQIKKVFSKNPFDDIYYISGTEGNGKYLKFNNSGILIEQCSYKNNELDGEFKEWDENTSILIKQCFYKNGNIVKKII